jgi:hypothetical protein
VRHNGQYVRLKKTGTLPKARQSACKPVEISRAVLGHRITIVPMEGPPRSRPAPLLFGFAGAMHDCVGMEH